MSDVSVELGLNAQELYSELQAITAKFVTFASQTSSAGEKAGSGFLSGLKSKIESAGGFLHGAGAQVLGGLGIGFSIGAVVSEIKSITEDTIAYAAKIEDFSRRFGVSTEILQKFGNVAEKNGSSVDGIAKAFQRLDIARAKALTGGPDNAFAKIFEHAGVSVEELNGPLDNLALKVGAAHLNAADFLKVFSKGGAEVRTTLEGLADGTFKFGGAISDVNIKKLKEAEDALKTLSQEVTILAGSALPGVFKLAELSAEGFISKLEIAGIHMAALAKFSANIVINPAAAFEALKEGAVETQAARKRSDKFSQEIKDRLDHPDTQKFHGPNLPTGDEESGETDDQGRPIGKGSAKSTAKEIERLKDENEKEEEALRLGRLDTETRINDLIAKRKGLEAELASVANRAGKEEGPAEELQRLQTKHDILAIDKQIAEAQKKQEAEKDKAAREADAAANKAAAADRAQAQNEAALASAKEITKEMQLRASGDEEGARQAAIRAKYEKEIAAALDRKNPNPALAAELGKQEHEAQVEERGRQLSRTPAQIAAEQAQAREKQNNVAAAEASLRDEADRRRRGSYTGPGGRDHSGLTTSGLETGRVQGAKEDFLSTDDWHDQFRSGNARVLRDRADEVKQSAVGKDAAAEKLKPVAEKQLSALEKIEKNTQELGKNK